MVFSKVTSRGTISIALRDAKRDDAFLKLPSKVLESDMVVGANGLVPAYNVGSSVRLTNASNVTVTLRVGCSGSWTRIRWAFPDP